MYKSFRDMPVWQNALELSNKVFYLTLTLPKSEDYSLTSQIRRLSNSITANIAEAFVRRTKNDKSHFYVIARGSAYETQSHLLYGAKVGYFEQKKIDDLFAKYADLIHELNSILKSLN